MQIKRRSISLLLIFAMMTVALVSLLPLTAAADPVGDNAADIQDFSYQTLSNANQTDETTDLRVMFTIGSLGYDAVGFVFSTSNSAPTAGGAGTYSTTTVHSTINAGGGNIPAGTGRFWVAVKLSAIPLASFETPIYVRPFIQVGENYSYIDAEAITVCQALTIDKTVAGESEIFDFSNPSGPYFSYNNFEVSKTIADIRGDQHFFKNLMDFGVAFACFLSLDGMQQRAAVFLMSLIFRNFFQIGSRVKTHNLFKYRMDLLRRFSCFLCRFRMQFSACIARFCMGVIGELKFWMCHNDLSSF